MFFFSHFHWLYPLQTKHSRGVKENIKKIFAIHSIPEKLQSGNGKEFKESVKQFCRMKKMRMVLFQEHNPRARKVERSYRVLRKEITFDMITQARSGTNWAKNLPDYRKCLNSKKREKLGW